MKTLNQFFVPFSFVVLVLGLIACNQDEGLTIEVANLPGCWKSQDRVLNGIEWRELTGFPPYRTLGISDNGGYFLNYVVGDWAVTDETLGLTHGYEEIITDNYQILYLSSDSLVLQSYLTGSDFSWNLPSFEPDEVITVVERFNR